MELKPFKDFFISYNHNDEDWSEWLAWQIEESGHSVILQKWDFVPGANWVQEMDFATKNAKAVILVLSDNFMSSGFTQAEWMAFFSKDPTGKDRKIIPIRVDNIKPEGLLAQIVYTDFFGKSEAYCKTTLQQLLTGRRIKPTIEPIFPNIKIDSEILKPVFPSTSPSYKFLEQSELSTSVIENIDLDQIPHVAERRTGRALASKVLDQLLEKLLVRRIHVTPISILVVDVDGMAGINKKFGIDAGDAVINEIGKFAEKVQNRMLSMRIGDDTFLIVLTQCNWVLAMSLGRKLVKDVASTNWEEIKHGLYVSCSIGATELDQSTTATEAISIAAEAQFKAREAGGNDAMLGRKEVSNQSKNWTLYIS